MKPLNPTSTNWLGLLLALATISSYAQTNDKITICHYPPGNPDNVQTIEISESAWPAHEAHGDDRGTCDASVLPAKELKPVLECVDHHSDGTFTAHFGYQNKNAFEVTVEVGDNNKFSPSPVDRGQPADFASGRQRDVFQVPFNGNNLVWTLRSPNGSSRTATASSNLAQKCENSDDDGGDDDGRGGDDDGRGSGRDNDGASHGRRSDGHE